MRKFLPLLFLILLVASLLLLFISKDILSKPMTPKVMFQHIEGDMSEIYTVEANGQTLAKIYSINGVKLPGSVVLPSPSGRYIAFIKSYNKFNSNNELKIFDLAGREVITLPLKVEPYRDYAGDSALPIEWSPLSEKLALIAEGQDGASDIYVYDVKKGTLVNVTQNPLWENSLAWSPDGKTIAFITATSYLSESDKTNGVNRLGQPSKIVMVNPEEINKRLLIDLSFDAQFANLTENSTLPCDLMWSPSGRYIALQVGCAEGTGATDIFIADTQQGNLLNVTNSLISNTPYYVMHSIRWAASNDFLAIGSYKQRVWLEIVPENTPTKVIKEMIVFDPNLMTSTKIDVGGIPISPIWSYQEKYMAWEEMQPSKVTHIFIGQYSQGKITLLKPEGIVGCNPKFSPDGNYLAYEYPRDENQCGSSVEGKFDIRTISLINGKAVNFTESLGGYNKILGWMP